MKADAAFAALHDANPVPDAQSFASDDPTVLVFLSSTKERSERMGTLEVETFPLRKPPPAHRWQPLTAAAVFVIVVALGVAVVLAGRMSFDTVDIPLPPYETPQTAAEAYLAAMVEGDFEAHQAMFGPEGEDWDLTPQGAAVTDPEHIEARVVVLGAFNESVENLTCEPLNEVTVECRYVQIDPIGRIIADDPDLAIRQTFRIDEEGRLDSVGSVNFERNEAQNLIHGAYHSWLSTNHPEVITMLEKVWGSKPIDFPVEELIDALFAAAKEYAALQDG